MSKDVTFNIRLLVDGKEKIVSATTDVQHFAKVFEDAKAESVQLRDKLIETGQTVQIIQAAFSGFQQAAGAIREMTAAYTEQSVVETKTANNMRNMMGAREEEIESIKALCAAQQELGVIGDEVQLAGAQEMATYLTKTSSLQKLIPVMNDMLAQQYGLNATQEEAANIAMMLGKVMEGQTGALSRYGYYFDEAQKKILEMGTEEERAAVLADIVTGAVGGMNEELAKTDAGKAKQLANTIGDIKEAIGAAFISIEPFIVAIGEVGLATTGMMTAWKGLKGIIVSIKGAVAATTTWNVATRAAAVSGKAFAAVSASLRAVMVVLKSVFTGAAVSANTLKLAIRGLLISTGVGAVIAGLTFVIEKLWGAADGASDSMDELSESEQRAKEMAEEGNRVRQETMATLNLHKAELEKLIEAKKTGKDVSKEEAKMVSELNDTYGETMGYFGNVVSWYQALCANSEAYCQQMANEINMRRIANEMAELQRLKKLGNDYYDGIEKIPGVNRESYSTHYGFGGEQYHEGTYEARERFNQKIDKQIQGKQDEAKQYQTNVAMPVTGSRVRPGTGKTGHTGVTGKVSRQELALVENAQTLKDLENNVRYYEQEIQKSNIADKEKIASLYALKKATEETISGVKKLGEASDEPAEGSLAALDKQLSDLRKQLQNEGNVESARWIVSDIKALEEEKKTLEEVLGLRDKEPAGPAEGSRAWKREQRQEYESRAQEIQQDYEVGIIGADEALSEIAKINVALEKLGMEPIEIPVMTEDLEKAQKEFDATWSSVQDLGNAFSGLGNALELPELNVAGVMAQAIATMVQAFATAQKGAAVLGPWAWVAFAATGLAQLTAMVSSVKGMAKFADGGIVSGATLALVGEYAGASNNPEVIAPLDKLRSLIGGTGGNGVGKVRFEIRGRALKGVLSNEERIGSKLH